MRQSRPKRWPTTLPVGRVAEDGHRRFGNSKFVRFATMDGDLRPLPSLGSGDPQATRWASDKR
jgi:hypothetical protein